MQRFLEVSTCVILILQGQTKVVELLIDKTIFSCTKLNLILEYWRSTL